MLKKILIANRGEIAVRIIRACRFLNIQTVAIFSDIDTSSLHVKMADEAFCLGNGSVQETYLNIEKIIDIAIQSQSDGIHPGYGFLSENANFAVQVEKNDLIFVGPKASVLKRLSNKFEAKKSAKEIGLQVIPGSSSVIYSISEAEKAADTIGYPVIIKAVYGAGGRGIEVVKKNEDLERSFIECQSVAEKIFGDNAVYLEKYLEGPRHIEIQFLADNHDNIIHLGDRECSIQRAHQKIIEEAPSFLSKEIIDSLGQKVCSLVKSLSYTNIGTVEFLWKNNQLFFNEINSRIQVEHPVTEMITGIDLVIEQLRIANNEVLSYTQEEVIFDGHVIEFRINAENPFNGFYPQTGIITNLTVPVEENVRFDTFIYPNYLVPNKYDSLVGKLVVKSTTREKTIEKSLNMLKELKIDGVITNIYLHKAILKSPEFREGEITNLFLNENRMKKLIDQHQKLKLAALITTDSFLNGNKKLVHKNLTKISKKKSRWREINRLEKHQGHNKK
ncbi:MAG: ATP-grasp domain-containing protein [Candidatus Heimdallarchaeota archaeon]|nr:ATP-grasp domain-containing protein [Candidatus Heimdallarchaeota archaeon]